MKRALLDSFLKEKLPFIEEGISSLITLEEEISPLLSEAMRYTLFAGGKRLRPLLFLASFESFKTEQREKESLFVLIACLEFLHTYSLIHDDLPAMDNDDFRRGKPTSHKLFGEGMAILAGDGLLTRSFEILSLLHPPREYPLREFLKEIGAAAGALHLIGGQALDLQLEGKEYTLDQVKKIHQGKTAAMISLSLKLGAMIAGASRDSVEQIALFGESLGLAFQIIDDVLDLTQTQECLGKTAGKDLKAEKATYPALLGVESSWREAEKLTQRAHEQLKKLNLSTPLLKEFSDFLLERQR